MLEHPELMELSRKIGALEQKASTLDFSLQQVVEQQKELLNNSVAWMARFEEVSGEDHKVQHQFVEALIRDRKQIQELRQQIIHKIITGGALGFVTGISALVWLGFKTKYGINE